MKKIFGLIFICAFLNNCAPTVSDRYSKAWGAKVNNKYGGSVRVEPLAGTSFNQIKQTADNYCRSQGSQYAKNITKSTKGGALTWYFYNFECYPAYENKLIAEKKRKLEEQKKLEQQQNEIAQKEKEKKKDIKKKQILKDNEIVAAGSGTGFIVSNSGHIISNHHVVEGCKTTKVSFKGLVVDANVLAVDKVNDIAILQANIKPNKIFSVSKDDVSLLEDVIVAGYPLGKNISSAIKTHKGVVTALAGAGDNYSEFQTDATINQGNSGGPVINQKGNVVGVAVALMDVSVGQNMFFAIKSSTLKQFANSNNLKFANPKMKNLSNKELGNLITESTVYLECYMTVAKIKQMIAEKENRKAFFKEFK